MMQYQSHDTYGQQQYEDSMQSTASVAESNLRSAAVQRSLFDIFQEFTVLISGEIKNQAEREQGKSDLNIQA
jgi:hypothetical protein